MVTPKITASQRLRDSMSALLARAAEDLNEPDLTWDEREEDLIARAAATADAAESLRRRFTAEEAGENRYTVLVKLSAEARACDRQVTDLLAKLNPGGEPAKSSQQQRAVNYRHDRNRRLRSI